MKLLTILSLLASAVLYLAQILVYTKDQEILVYGAFGALWYFALYRSSLGVKLAPASIIVVSVFAAFGLGFVPHRLRLGGDFDLYVVLFPAIHFLTTFAFFAAQPDKQGRGMKRARSEGGRN